MDDQLWLKWTALAALMGCYIFFASAETSLFSLSPLARLKLKHRHPGAGGRIDRLLARPQRLLTSIIIGNEVAVIVATVLATSISLSLWGNQGKWLALGVMAPAMLLFGEIIPKSLALRYPEGVARLIAPPLAAVLPLFTPFRVVLLHLSHIIMGLLRIRPQPPGPLLQEDDFLRMVEDSHKGGLIAPLEKDLIVNLMGLGATTVAQVMIPRSNIFALPLQGSATELIAAMKQARFSRAPVYGAHRDDILGILHAKDLLQLAGEQNCEQSCLKNLLRPAYYVPEHKRAFDLLQELQSRKIRQALVVDEYGTLTGLVSVQDIMTELFGKFDMAGEEPGPPLEQTAPGVYLVKGWMPLAELTDTLDLSLPAGEFETVGGFVLHLFGELPQEGDTITHDGLKFEVLHLKGTRIAAVLLSREET